MRTPSGKPLLLLLALTLSGCMASAPLRPLTDTTSPIAVNGFTVTPPQDAGWYVQQTDSGVVFYKLLGTGTTPEREFEPQTFFIAVTVNSAESDEFATAAALLHHIEKNAPAPDASRRQRLLSYRASAYTAQGTDCVRYAVSFEEQPRRQMLEMSSAGFVCRHPAAPDRVVHATYSERHARDAVVQSTEAPIREAEVVLRNVSFTPMR